MHLYTVTDVDPGSKLVALRDQNGRYHAAHCTSRLPALGEQLHGPLPERGFTLLIAPDGAACRMTFSQINCGQAGVRSLLHASAAGGTRPLTATARPAGGVGASPNTQGRSI